MRLTLSSKSRLSAFAAPIATGAVDGALDFLAYWRSHSSCEASPTLGLGDVAAGTAPDLFSLAVSADDWLATAVAAPVFALANLAVSADD